MARKAKKNTTKTINQALVDDVPQLLQQILKDCHELAIIATKEDMNHMQERHKSLKILLQNIELLLSLNPPDEGNVAEDYQSMIDEANKALQKSFIEMNHHEAKRL